MSRVKTFDNTGIATSGRLYAGDLNLMQDQYADLVNLLQTHAVGVLQIGETGLQLLRYGAGEARLSGMLRTDGIIRALGGLYAGAFTTTQRDAITAGSRPYGLVILNSTTNRLEWNAGTDASPIWQPISDAAGTVPIGSTIDWAWAAGSIPTGYLLPYGQAISRTTYPVLAALAAASGYPHGNGDGSTTFNLPDYRGRVGVGKDDMGGTAAGRITTAGAGMDGTLLGASGGAQTITLTTGQLAVHSHGSVALGISGIPGLTDPQHAHNVYDPQHQHLYSAIAPGGSVGFMNAYDNGPWQNAGIATDPALTGIGIYPNGTGITVNAGTLDVSGTTDNSGTGQAHSNLQPSLVVNKAMRVL